MHHSVLCLSVDIFHNCRLIFFHATHQKNGINPGTHITAPFAPQFGLLKLIVL
jgi:hypothetical protein